MPLYSPATAVSISYGTTLPPSASDGALAVLVDSTSAPTYQWLFRYNSSEATYKWECIGGTPAFSHVETLETNSGTAGSFHDLATVGPTFTLPYGGDYLFELSAGALTGAGSDYMAIGISVGTSSVLTNTDVNHTAAAIYIGHRLMWKATGRSASDAMRIRYYSSTRTDNQFDKRRMWVMPIRVTT